MFDKDASCKEFNAPRSMLLDNFFNHFHPSQYAVGMAAKMKCERLCFIRNNRKHLLSENYIHLRDSIHHDLVPGNLGWGKKKEEHRF